MADVLVAALEGHVEEPHDVPGLLEEGDHVLPLCNHDRADCIGIDLQRNLLDPLLRWVEPAEVLHSVEVAETDAQIRGSSDSRDRAAEAAGLQHRTRWLFVEEDVQQGLAFCGSPSDDHLGVDDVDFARDVHCVGLEGGLDLHVLPQRTGHLDGAQTGRLGRQAELCRAAGGMAAEIDAARGRRLAEHGVESELEDPGRSAALSLVEGGDVQQRDAGVELLRGPVEPNTDLRVQVDPRVQARASLLNQEAVALHRAFDVGHGAFDQQEQVVFLGDVPEPQTAIGLQDDSAVLQTPRIDDRPSHLDAVLQLVEGVDGVDGGGRDEDAVLAERTEHDGPTRIEVVYLGRSADFLVGHVIVVHVVHVDSS